MAATAPLDAPTPMKLTSLGFSPAFASTKFAITLVELPGAVTPIFLPFKSATLWKLGIDFGLMPSTICGARPCSTKARRRCPLGCMLINFVAWDSRPAAGSDGLGAEAVARRIQPVGVSDYKDVNDVKSMKTGEQVFAAQCTACHTSGAVGAPKIGDEAAWAPRVKTGFDALLHSALKGKGNMPAQGGGDSSDFEIARAVVFMANKGGAKFDEPKAPAAAASAAASATK